MERVHLGEREHAAAASGAEREAVSVYRRLAAASPGRYLAGLAEVLVDLGTTLTGRGLAVEALPLAVEAVTIRRELAAASPERHRAGLAQPQDCLAAVLAAIGRPAGGRPAGGRPAGGRPAGGRPAGGRPGP
jgi:hypothetical protein